MPSHTIFEQLKANLQSPTVGLAAGLLQGASPGSSLGQGLSLGVQLQNNIARGNSANNALVARVAEMKATRQEKARIAAQKAAKQAAIAQASGLPEGLTPGPGINRAIAQGLQPGTPAFNEAIQPSPLVEINQGQQGDQIRALSPNEQDIINSGEPFIDNKGKVTVAKDLPQVQKTAAGFANRMISAQQNMDAVDFDMTSSFGGRSDALPGELQPENFQRKVQAQEEFVRAKLRKESGAVIGDDEMATERRVLFPQPGDGPQVVLQKAITRIESIRAMVAESGNAFQGEIEQLPEVFRGKEPADAKPGDIWVSPSGEIRVFEE